MPAQAKLLIRENDKLRTENARSKTELRRSGKGKRAAGGECHPSSHIHTVWKLSLTKLTYETATRTAGGPESSQDSELREELAKVQGELEEAQAALALEKKRHRVVQLALQKELSRTTSRGPADHLSRSTPSRTLHSMSTTVRSLSARLAEEGWGRVGWGLKSASS